MENLNQQMGNMRVQARPGTPPGQGTYTGSAPPVERKRHTPHQFSPGFQGRKLDGHYGTGQPQEMPGGKRKKSKHYKRMAKKSRRRTRKKSKSRRGRGKWGDRFKAFKSGVANRTAKLRDRAAASYAAAKARAVPAFQNMAAKARSGISGMRERAAAKYAQMKANPNFQAAMQKFSPRTKMPDIAPPEGEIAPSEGEGGRKRRKKSRKKSRKSKKKKRRKHKKKSRRKRRR